MVPCDSQVNFKAANTKFPSDQTGIRLVLWVFGQKGNFKGKGAQVRRPLYQILAWFDGQDMQFYGHNHKIIYMHGLLFYLLA